MLGTRDCVRSVRITVTGAGGAIAGHAIRSLLDDGHEVYAFDIKPLAQWWQVHEYATNWGEVDVSQDAEDVCHGAEWVFNYACVMGGLPFIESHRVDCAMSVLITANMLQAAADCGVARFFQSSSACACRTDLQTEAVGVALKESDAWPALPEQGYGLEKLYGEELCRFFREERGLETRVARFHNIMATHCSWNDGKEKSPAALCRKVAEAVVSGRNEILIYGDGEQSRSYCWIDDCVEGTLRLMASDFADPMNIGSSELVTINELVTIIEEVAGVAVERRYDVNAPQGVRGRSSNNTLVREVLGWEPTTSLRDGIAQLYPWILEQVKAAQ